MKIILDDTYTLKRCKDCIRYGDEHIGAGWCDEHEHLTNDDDYCSYAVGRLAEMEGAE